jgi:hypothetical protein
MLPVLPIESAIGLKEDPQQPKLEIFENRRELLKSGAARWIASLSRIGSTSGLIPA